MFFVYVAIAVYIVVCLLVAVVLFGGDEDKRR